MIALYFGMTTLNIVAMSFMLAYGNIIAAVGFGLVAYAWSRYE